MAELRQYDPTQVVASWATPIGAIDIVEGAIQGDFLAVARDNANWTREFDNAGNSTRVKNSNTGGTITVTLSASSPANINLSAAAQTDVLTENVTGEIVIRDLSGSDLVTAQGAFLEMPPDPTYGQDRGVRVYVFQCASITTFNGGHNLA